MIKNVIFDIGNVLVDFRWRVLMEELGLPAETQAIFAKTVFGSRWWGELDHGIYEEAEILAHFREDNKEHLDEFDLVWDNRGRLVEPYAYAVAWIEQLKASGLKVYLLSNYPRDVFTLHTECGCFPFLDRVDGRVVSGFVKMVKPNADIYEYLLSEYGLAAGECVFVDDREENVETARALGMKGIVFQGYEQACSELDGLVSSGFSV
ncbi:MAG: HAD family phosphatase [Lachnospiraceae bacterium]|jgi:putative hydrolase of the HAD superfamily